MMRRQCCCCCWVVLCRERTGKQPMLHYTKYYIMSGVEPEGKFFLSCCDPIICEYFLFLGFLFWDLFIFIFGIKNLGFAECRARTNHQSRKRKTD